MYNVDDVARYIINYCNDNNYYLNHFKLAQILYFCQAEYLVNNKQLFKEDIIAVDWGVCIESIYKEYKGYGTMQIPRIEKWLDTSKGIWNFKEKTFSYDIINDEDKQIINNIIKETNKYTYCELVEIIHKQTPWTKSWAKSCFGRFNIVIDKKLIKDFFK